MEAGNSVVVLATEMMQATTGTPEIAETAATVEAMSNNSMILISWIF
jgi:hypothetical protein